MTSKNFCYFQCFSKGTITGLSPFFSIKKSLVSFSEGKIIGLSPIFHGKIHGFRLIFLPLPPRIRAGLLGGGVWMADGAELLLIGSAAWRRLKRQQVINKNDGFQV
jgi:hypothetical protein